MHENGTFALMRQIDESCQVSDLTLAPCQAAVPRWAAHVGPDAYTVLFDGWQWADDATRGLFPDAVFMRQLGGDGTYAPYDLTLACDHTADFPWTPIHGTVRMPCASTAAEAATVLIEYWDHLPEYSKLAARQPGQREGFY